MGPDLDEVGARVQGDGGHGVGVVVRHLHRPVPLAGVAVQQQPQARTRHLLHTPRPNAHAIASTQPQQRVSGGEPHPPRLSRTLTAEASQTWAMHHP